MVRLPQRRPLLYAITDRRALPGQDPLPFIKRAIAARIDLIQVRERDLNTHDLLALVEAAVECARGRETRILVNDRLDVALAAGSAGVHLPTHGLPVGAVRQRYPELIIGASTHNLDELRRAEEGGADFAVFGPVYETPSKKEFGPPVGLDKLAQAARTTKLPVLALGGVGRKNAGGCLAAGAAGIAAISLFQRADDLGELASWLRNLPAAK